MIRPSRNSTAEREYVYQEKLEDSLQWCLLKFEAKVRCQLDALVIGSHLESDAAMADACRIAFHGRLVERAEGDAIGEKIRLYKLKRKVGLVAKLGDPPVCPRTGTWVLEMSSGKICSRGRRTWRSSSGVVQCLVSLRVDGVFMTRRRSRRSSTRHIDHHAGSGSRPRRARSASCLHAFGKGGKFRCSSRARRTCSPAVDYALVYKKYVSSKALHQDDDCVVPPMN